MIKRDRIKILDQGNCDFVRNRGEEAYVKSTSLRTETFYKAGVVGELAQHSKTHDSTTQVQFFWVSKIFFPDLLLDDNVEVRAILPKRTFWEKAMLLHEETYRPASGKRGKEYMGRHYYDLYRLIEAGVAGEAMADEELFAHVASHRIVFFRQNWVDYSTLVRGQLRVVPTDEQMPDWRSDYSNMQQEMFFGEEPDFESVMEKVCGFHDDFNQG